MSALQNLREKRANAWEEAKSFLNRVTNSDGRVSDEDAAIYDRMETDIHAMGKEIERLERQAALDLELSRPLSEPVRTAPGAYQGEPKEPRATDEYRRDFFNVMRGKPVTNLLQEGVDTDGGYLVPVEFDRNLVQAMADANIMRRLANVITTAAPRKIPMVAQESTASWVDENATIPESTVTFAQKTIDAYKLTDLVRVSQELLYDSMFNLPAFLTREFARALGAAEEQAFLVGTGIGRPTGLFRTTGGADIGVTAASTSSISFDDLIGLVYSLRVPYRRNARFIMNDGTVGAVRKLKDSNGQFLWQPSLQVGEPDRLIGYPIYTSPYVPTLAASALVASFGDYSNYWIADRQGRSMQRLVELYSINGQVGFLISQRVDGKVILSEGIKLLQMRSA
jgi:HK97 family phage major capsid protein